MTSTGRTFAAIPRSASQIFPRLGMLTPLLLLIHQGEHLHSGGRLILFGPKTIAIIVKNSYLSGAVLLSESFLYGPKFHVIQPGQCRSDFAYCAHVLKIDSSGSAGKLGLATILMNDLKFAMRQAAEAMAKVEAARQGT